MKDDRMLVRIDMAEEEIALESFSLALIG